MDTREIIRKIFGLLETGTPIVDILVNVGNDSWGESMPTTRRNAEELITDWNNDRDEDNQLDTEDTLAQLVEAEEYLGDHRTEHLMVLAEMVRGMAYSDAQAGAILDRCDWSDYWPVVEFATLPNDLRADPTGEGYACLTSDQEADLVYAGWITDSGDPATYLNVDDMAMIAI